MKSCNNLYCITGKAQGHSTELKAHTYYVEVEPDKKLSALLNLSRALNANSLSVALHDVLSKPAEFQKDLYDIIGYSVVSERGSWSIFSSNFTRDRNSGFVLVVFDGMCSENLLDHQVDLVIILSSNEDRESLVKIQARELSASAFIYFKGGKILPFVLFCSIH